MRNRWILGAVLALNTCSGPAWAGAWTGCYGELGLGVEVANTRISADVGGTTLAALDGVGGDGLVASLGGGCDYQIDKLVVGILGRWDLSRAESTLTLGTAAIKLDMDNRWLVGGRLGVAIRPDVLAYIMAAWGESGISVNGPGFSLATDVKGITVGGGLETHLQDQWFLKVEYNWTQYDSAALATFGPLAINAETDVHVARAALVWRFRAPERAR